MRTYQYYSTLIGVDVQVTYNEHGLLHAFSAVEKVDNIKTATAIQLHNYLKEIDFIAAAKQHKLKYTEVQRVVTFDMFWDKYAQKDCGRKKAEALWNTLGKADQIRAFDYIDYYNGILKMNSTAKAYATTYLNQKRWIR